MVLPTCRDLSKLQAEAAAANGVVNVKVNGSTVALTVGKEIFFSASAAAGSA